MFRFAILDSLKRFPLVPLWKSIDLRTETPQVYDTSCPQTKWFTVDGMTYKLTLADGRTIHIAGADTYEQEGPLLTFFDNAGRQYVDTWSHRVASYRTADVSIVESLIDHNVGI
jgi:hypothetical protein